MQDERLEAKSRGSESPWLVHKNYRVDGSILKEGHDWSSGFKMTPGSPEYYYPAAHPEIVPAVASLTKGNETAVLEFAHLWGLLGRDVLVRHHPGLLGHHDTSERVAREEEEKGGDPLSWIWAHAETVRRILQLIRLLAKCKDAELYDKGTRQAEAPVKKLETYLESIAIPFSGTRPLSSDTDPFIRTHFELALGIAPVVDMSSYGMHSEITVNAWRDPEKAKRDPMTPQRMAQEIVGQVISSNLVGIEPSMRWHFTSGGLERTFILPAPISAVYWYLSDAAVGGKGYIQCQWRKCGKWIQQEHGHQRYCPPEKGKESLCSLKSRQDRWTSSHLGERQ